MLGLSKAPCVRPGHNLVDWPPLGFEGILRPFLELGPDSINPGNWPWNQTHAGLGRSFCWALLVIFNIFLEAWWTAYPDSRLPSEPDLEARMKNGTWWRLLKISKTDICVPCIQNFHGYEILGSSGPNQIHLQVDVTMFSGFLITHLFEKWVLCGHRRKPWWTSDKSAGFSPCNGRPVPP